MLGNLQYNIGKKFLRLSKLRKQIIMIKFNMENKDKQLISATKTCQELLIVQQVPMRAGFSCRYISLFTLTLFEILLHFRFTHIWFVYNIFYHYLLWILGVHCLYPVRTPVSPIVPIYFTIKKAAFRKTQRDLKIS